MKATPRVVGLVQACNEWPLLALSISHALMHHVDEVYVLIHASADATCGGMRRLQELWNGRIHIFAYYDEHFWQEACLSTLMEVSQATEPDWLYVFDADEFLITGGDGPLRDILGEVGQEHHAVRYEVQNWVSTRDFDHTDLSRYRQLRYRALPNVFLNMNARIISDEIHHGDLNFFDVPFGSKVIVRNGDDVWLAPGTHHLKSPAASHEMVLASDTLCAAHLPFLSWARLALKVAHGRSMDRDRFPTAQGWQSRMIWALAQEGVLEDFWASHSVHAVGRPDGGAPGGPDGTASGRSDEGAAKTSDSRTTPTLLHDDRLVHAIEPTLRFVEDGLDCRLLRHTADQSPAAELDSTAERNPSTDQPIDTPIPFRAAVHSARRLQLIADEARAERDALAMERDRLLTENRDLRADMAAQMAGIRASAAWRLTAPLRLAGRLVRGQRA